MRAVKAVFKKQFKSSVQNPEMLIQFLIFPFMAFMMTRFVGTDAMMDDILYFAPYIGQDFFDAMAANMPNLVTMMAGMFAGMALIPAVAGIIAEDKEKTSLRFLIMAGVKPSAYLVGVGSVILFVSALTSLAFAFVGEFRGMDFAIFMGAMLSGVTASIVLGAAIGIISKGQQSATALAMPIAMVLGFGPMMAQFNDNVARALNIFYSQQINIIADYITIGTDTPLWQSFAIMWANILVLAILFAIVYAKKGLTTS
ncbi:MAG: ABC transporter permease [Defluviitaleaceae bacterium]|nr:ABC transporter permease [Defluviitaleaceae bacterium]